MSVSIDPQTETEQRPDWENAPDGQMLSAEDKPEIDDETGLITYEDAEGNEQQIPQTSVKQIIER